MLINAFVKRELIFGDKRYFPKKKKKKRKRDQIPLKIKIKKEKEKVIWCSKSIDLETFYRKKIISFIFLVKVALKFLKKDSLTNTIITLVNRLINEYS